MGPNVNYFSFVEPDLMRISDSTVKSCCKSSLWTTNR